MIEERRTCYVALTRARRKLLRHGRALVRRDAEAAKTPERVLRGAGGWGEESGHASVDRGPERGRGEPARRLPGALRPRLARPGASRRRRRAVPGGVAASAAGAVRLGAVPALPRPRRSLPPSARRTRRSRPSGGRSPRICSRARRRRASGAFGSPSTVSVGGLVDYAPVPEALLLVAACGRSRGSAARPRGSAREIHRWIERRSHGQGSAARASTSRPTSPPRSSTGEPGRIERAAGETFLESRFAGAVPLFAERPFLLPLEGVVVRGRIDAIFGAPRRRRGRSSTTRPGGGPTSRSARPHRSSTCTRSRASTVWGKRPEDLTLTYLYLSSGAGGLVRRRTTREAIRARVATWLRGIAAGEFDPTPGEHCRWCDFLSFCDAGRGWIDANDPGGG